MAKIQTQKSDTLGNILELSLRPSMLRLITASLVRELGRRGGQGGVPQRPDNGTCPKPLWHRPTEAVNPLKTQGFWDRSEECRTVHLAEC